VQSLCPRCQKSVNADQQFCVHCGFALATQDAATVPELAPASSRSSTHELAGRVLDGKYHLQKRIGSGGMGAVYLARRVHIGDEVAVKVLHPHYVSEASAVERFRREARAAAMLRHPGIVAIYDFGEAREKSPAYIVMELVNGVSLRALLQHERRLEPARAVALMREICAAVGTAHRHNVVHRDLKPDNVLVLAPELPDEQEKVKVLDFGIAKLRDLAPDQSLTQTGAVMGTPYYMSPEQCRGDALDARSDVYSLGAMLYELIAGQPPFTANTITGVVAKHLTEAPAPLGLHVPILPALEAAVMRALAKNPDLRQAGATDFARDLQSALRAPTGQFDTPSRRRNQAARTSTGSYGEATVAVPPPLPTATQPAAPPTRGTEQRSLRTSQQFKQPSVKRAETGSRTTSVERPKAPRGFFLWSSVIVAVFILLAGFGVWLLQKQLGIGPIISNNITPSPPATSPTAANLMPTTTDTGDVYAAETKTLNVSRIESAEALLVGGAMVTEADLATFSPAELRVLRNTVFARHGRTFESPGLQRFFNSRKWYKTNANYSDELLTDIDRVNLRLIAQVERQTKAAQAIAVQSSSALSDEYNPGNTRDDRIETAWVEGATGAGVGEWVAFTFQPQTIQFVEIYPGYGKSSELFYANNRLKRATLIFSDGTRASVQLFDQMRMQTVVLQKGVRASSLRLIIEEVYPGTKYEDTVIAEINWR
jgi:eukaryotic-like serine/threonine-protein kinase